MNDRSPDNLFRSHDPGPGGFRFDENVAAVFEDMLQRSIPHYREVIVLIHHLLQERLKTGDRVCDLGCSLGTAFHHFYQNDHKKLNYLGLDNSPAMIDKARKLSLEKKVDSKRIDFLQADIVEDPFPSSQAVLLQYVLHFISPEKRPLVLKKIYDCLTPGGLFIISEKTRIPDSVHKTYTGIYEDFKTQNGYSREEIHRKKEALENVLIPQSYRALQENLHLAGFTTIEPLFHWVQFSTWVAVK